MKFATGNKNVIEVCMQNFWVTDVSTSRDMTSQILHFHEETIHRDLTFAAWKSAKFQRK